MGHKKHIGPSMFLSHLATGFGVRNGANTQVRPSN